MESFYIILVGILFLLAISDLVVGVSNDAVNFLNSAIGAKVAPFRTIMVIAAAGVLVGAAFSGGMMEVARKGIFHPEFFTFQEIMFLFLAVMITDVILLDVYNTLGMPTSTTVSIVFELLGAAVGLSLLKAISNPDVESISHYINSDKALQIIFGILLSVVVAFAIGALVQYITRLIFSFDYKKKIKYLGGIFGGVAITAITYFILIKGAKGATFMTAEMKHSIMSNALVIMGVSFIFWTLVLQILYSFFKIDILKVVVLVGTFALAMAFAGNDLVNFIGVPLAGLASFKEFIGPAGENPEALMKALSGPVKTSTYYLIGAGIVMVITLWTSKKARSVVDTSINLSRQHEGTERFGSSGISRAIVRNAMGFGKRAKMVLPPRTRKYISKQFDPAKANEANEKTGISFDKIRAAVNLIVAAVLISFATSLKLPLSTTYVTFMVAMGTSLADRAWGRESAVYRITGVFSVIGGWFLTALSAFTVAFIVVNFIAWGELYAIIIMVIIAIIMIIRTHKLHSKKRNASEKAKQAETNVYDNDGVMKSCTLKTQNTIDNISENYKGIVHALYTEDRKEAKKVLKSIKTLNKELKEEQNNLSITITRLQEEGAETSHFFVQVVGYLREIAHCLNYMAEPAYEHIDNMHKGLSDTQKEEIDEIQNQLFNILRVSRVIIKENAFVKIDDLIAEEQKLLKLLKNARKNQIKRIKHKETGKKNSMLYLNILQETKNMSLYSVNLIKAHRDFVIYNDSEHY